MKLNLPNFPAIVTKQPPEMMDPEPVQPPVPRQMNHPVGPPPSETATPTDFQGCMDLALKAQAPFKPYWVERAKAHAMNRIANALDTLVEMCKPEVDEHGELSPGAMSEVIADGILMAAQTQDEEKATQKKR